MTLVSGIILFIPMIRIKDWRRQIDGSGKLLTLRGLMEVFFMICKLFGLQYLEPQYVSGIQKLTLVFSVAIGGKAFHEHDQKKRIFTSLLIVVGSVLIVWSKVG
jgi:drug/metabolite transporter (DMT)-like permease